jgi:hypothetical protein
MINIQYTIIGFGTIVFVLLVIFISLKPPQRDIYQKLIGIISSTIGFLSLFFLLLDKLNQTNIEKKTRVSKLNEFTNSSINNIINTLSNKEDKLKDLYEEIFENKPMQNNNLTYQENLFMYQLFTVILNLYREYEINGKDDNLYQNNMYKSWENFIKKVCLANKTKIYWRNNKKLFDSLDFIKFMEEKYIGTS